MAFHQGLDPRHVTAEIHRLVRPGDREVAGALLEGIRDLGWDVAWLQLAALNLSGGRVDLLPQWIALANTDPRDVKMATLRVLDPSWDAKYQGPVRCPACGYFLRRSEGSTCPECGADTPAKSP